jgi:3-hydroxyacyl-CoA dehydrogenase
MNTTVCFPKGTRVETCGIKRAAVIGAGSMGAGIAAQFANAGVSVDLLDIPGNDASSRNAPAQAGLDRQMKANGFMHPGAVGLVRIGNVEDDLDRLAEADWIVEAVIEKLDVKRDLYRRLEQVRKPGSIVSSNTSTIQRVDLINGLSDTFAADFIITHFFNPPRPMRLVEIVSASENSPGLVARARAACETILGKTVIDCRDTPGFIANRVGCYWTAMAALEGKRLGLTVEEADTVMAAFGVPRTGVFGLLDLIGIDLVPHVWGSLIASLPLSDDIHSFALPSDPLVKNMIAAGRFGRKAKAGFYRIAADKSREALDMTLGEYRKEAPFKTSELPGKGRDFSALIDAESRLGQYAWSVLSRLVAYAAECGPEIADDIGAIDVAMELGYAWKNGPFKLADRYGAANIMMRMKQDGQEVPSLLQAAAENGGFYDARGLALRTDGTRVAASMNASRLSLPAIKLARPRVLGSEAASLWDAGNGVACFEVHTKMNSLGPPVFDVLEETLGKVVSDFRALVIGNDDARAFSAGADLAFFIDCVRRKDWTSLDRSIVRGQALFLEMKYAPFPVVAAAAGLALGGGCEFMLHCNAIVAHAELNAGLPEPKVGLIPGWGGCTQLLLRLEAGGGKDATEAALSAFEIILADRPSSSALEARDMHLVRAGDDIAMNRDHLLSYAIQRAISMADAGYVPEGRARIQVAGPQGKQKLMSALQGRPDSGSLTEMDIAVADMLAAVLTGGQGANPAKSMSEEEMMSLERGAVLALAKIPTTKERIEHILATGKPLRN